MNILKGLLEVVGGIIAGLILGLFLCCIPSKDQVRVWFDIVLCCSAAYVLNVNVLDQFFEFMSLFCLPAGGPGAEKNSYVVGSVHIFSLL